MCSWVTAGRLGLRPATNHCPGWFSRLVASVPPEAAVLRPREAGARGQPRAPRSRIPGSALSRAGRQAGRREAGGGSAQRGRGGGTRPKCAALGGLAADRCLGDAREDSGRAARRFSALGLAGGGERWRRSGDWGWEAEGRECAEGSGRGWRQRSGGARKTRRQVGPEKRCGGERWAGVPARWPVGAGSLWRVPRVGRQGGVSLATAGEAERRAACCTTGARLARACQKGVLVRSGIRTHASRGDCDLNAAP